MKYRQQIVRISDLRRPKLTHAHRRELELAEKNPVDLGEDEVLSAARRSTGLDDFGPDDFRERLRGWLAAVEDDTRRTALGRAAAFRRCVRYASTRLRLQDLQRRHPEIADVEIHQPIIVVGPFRSGTTHLVNLLATDTRLRSLRLWECYEPIPAPDDEAPINGRDPRFIRCNDEWQQTLTLLPHMAAIHPMDADHVHEEVELQGPDFASCLIDLVRPWCDQYAQERHTPRYEYMKTMLQALQWRQGPERWVLKSPHHAEHLPELLATFPDATVVFTHRDPVAVVQSAATMRAYLARLDYDEVDTDALIAYWTEQIEVLLWAMVRDRGVVHESQLVDVLFHDFMADKLEAVERIYATAGLDLAMEQRRRLAAFLRDNPRDKNGRIVYDLRADFGLDPGELRTRFAFYYERFPIEVEVR